MGLGHTTPLAKCQIRQLTWTSFCCRSGQKTLILEHVAPATRLLEKRRQMFEVQEALEAQKTEFAR